MLQRRRIYDCACLCRSPYCELLGLALGLVELLQREEPSKFNEKSALANFRYCQYLALLTKHSSGINTSARSLLKESRV